MSFSYQENRELPLAFGVSNASEWLADNLVLMCSSYRDAVRMCWDCRRTKDMRKATLSERAGLVPQHVSDYLARDDNPGRRCLPAEKVAAFEAVCGNRCVTQWLARQKGITIMEEVIARKAA